MINTFDITIVIGAVCGLTMVIGGILLLWKGAISLAAVSEEGALSVELRNEIKITTRYPALGIFVLGLVFIFLSIFFARPKSIHDLKIFGEVRDVSEPISLLFETETWNSDLKYQGKIREVIQPSSFTIKVTITAPEYQSKTKTITLAALSKGVIDLGEFSLNRTNEPLTAKNKNIVPLPSDDSLPGIEKAGAF